MTWKTIVQVSLLGLAVTGLASASDPQPRNSAPEFTADAQMILSATGDLDRSARGGETNTCLMMRTYRVRKDMDRASAIPTAPNQAAFKPNDIIGYSVCQKSNKFEVKSTQ